MKTDSSFKQIISAKLMDSQSKEPLLEFISWLDKECYDTPYGSLAWQTLVRSITAVGYVLAKKKNFSDAEHPVKKTITAGEKYISDPTIEKLNDFCSASTNSYPFGPGEGCYSIASLGYPGCEPGSGCYSGAGSLVSLGLEENEIWTIVKNALLTWINEETDI